MEVRFGTGVQKKDFQIFSDVKAAIERHEIKWNIRKSL